MRAIDGYCTASRGVPSREVLILDCFRLSISGDSCPRSSGVDKRTPGDASLGERHSRCRSSDREGCYIPAEE